MSHHVMLHEIPKQGPRENLHLSIDQKVQGQTWIFRIIDTKKEGSDFSCLVNKLTRELPTCSVEIARARSSDGNIEAAEILKKFIMCKPLFKFLGIRFVEWQRSLSGEIRIYDLERG